MTPLSDGTTPPDRWPSRLLTQAPAGESAASDDARMFRAVAWVTALVITAVMPLVAIAQPDTAERALRNVIIIDGMVALTLWMASRGQVRRAALVYLVVTIGLITFNALPLGGIRSPGVQAYFLFVMVAGLLLGARAGAWTAVACAALGLALVAAEGTLLAPVPAQDYNSLVRWLLICLYMGVAVVTMRVATARVERSLAAAHRELTVRRAAEERLDRALDAGRIGVFEHELKEDRLHVDDRARALLGIAGGEDGPVPVSEWQQLVHPDDQEYVEAELARLWGGAAHARMQYRIVRPDGATRHIEAAAHTTLGAEGTPTVVHGMVTDVTDRLLAEEERERLVLDLGERVKELRLLHDAARLLRDARGADRLLLSELVARMPAAWCHGDAVARIEHDGIEVTSPGWRVTPWTQAASFTTRGGSCVLQVAYLHEHPPADEGPFLAEERAVLDSLAEMLRSHIEHYAVDRERQAVEAQLRHAQKMDALGTLAGGIAHDFNNILAAISSHAQLAALDVQAGPAAESLASVQRACGRARDLVRRILLFSQRQKPSPHRMDLGPVADEAVELLRAAVPSSVEIRTHTARGLPQVNIDPVQLHQVLMNLGTNAAYAMREHGGTLTIGLEAVVHAGGGPLRLDPGRYLRLTVRDTGVGMTPDVRERLFEPFFTTKGQAGTGLGLSIVHGIVQDHGGAIEVASEAGSGTTFEIYLPADDGDASPHDPVRTEVVRGAGQHIMYVDDEEIICHAMTRILVRLGYRCTGFTDPAAALHEFRGAPQDFDAVITDLQMPGMSGLDVVRAVREARPATPVVIASGYPPHGIASDPVARSITWMTKPATLEDIAATVHRMFASRPDGLREPGAV